MLQYVHINNIWDYLFRGKDKDKMGSIRVLHILLCLVLIGFPVLVPCTLLFLIKLLQKYFFPGQLPGEGDALSRQKVERATLLFSNLFDPGHMTHSLWSQDRYFLLVSEHSICNAIIYHWQETWNNVQLFHRIVFVKSWVSSNLSFCKILGFVKSWLSSNLRLRKILGFVKS